MRQQPTQKLRMETPPTPDPERLARTPCGPGTEGRIPMCPDDDNCSVWHCDHWHCSICRDPTSAGVDICWICQLQERDDEE